MLTNPIAIVAIAMVAIVLLALAFRFMMTVNQTQADLLMQKREQDAKDPGHVISNVIGGIFGGL